MSGGDPLERMVRALREEGEAPAPQSKLTKERIMRDVRPKARSRKWTWAIPIAALLAGSTVLAATGRLPEIVKSARELIWRTPSEPSAPPAAPRPSAVPAPAAIAEAPAAIAEAPVPTEQAPAPVASNSAATPKSAEPRAQAEPSAKKSVPAPSAPAVVTEATTATAHLEDPAPSRSASKSADPAAPPETETDDALSLYRRAHHLYFTEQNPSAALAAFDEYLAKNPKSPLVVDARYDRALCLVRLGRHAEARAALEPFADGKYGAYRQKDATRLLEALDKTSATPSK